LVWALGPDGTPSDALDRLGVRTGQYLLATVHRAENTDDPDRLAQIVAAFEDLEQPVVFPVHPRTRKALAEIGWSPGRQVHAIEPVGYRDMIEFERGARLILTDSG